MVNMSSFAASPKHRPSAQSQFEGDNKSSDGEDEKDFENDADNGSDEGKIKA